VQLHHAADGRWPLHEHAGPATVCIVALNVCLLFDGPAERAIRSLWDRLEADGVPTLRSHTHGSHHPHLSYVVTLRGDRAAISTAMHALPDNGPFEIIFDAFGAFRRGRISLFPSLPADLVARQQAVVEAARRTGALVHKHYEIGRWLPHSSLAPRVRTAHLSLLASAVYEVLPLTARITRAALIDSSTGELSPLDNIP
jgi:hypothetical protein